MAKVGVTSEGLRYESKEQLALYGKQMSPIGLNMVFPLGFIQCSIDKFTPIGPLIFASRHSESDINRISNAADGVIDAFDFYVVPS
jgi:hypothetical protein